MLPANRVLGCYHALLAADLEGLAEITPGSSTVQVRIADNANPEAILGSIRSYLMSGDFEATESEPRVVEVPICSDAELAPDLEAVAEQAGLSAKSAAELHRSSDYTVRILGFSPGFAYLDGLPEALRVPRLDTPRPRVRAGSVGIAGTQTGIYPQATPGGWRLIGATPLRLFDATRDPPAVLAPGDRVQFRCITRDEFDEHEAGYD